MADDLPDAPWATGGSDLPDAPWVKPEEPSTLGDVAKSAGVGLAKGAIGVAGLPGDIASGLNRGIDWAGEKLFGTKPQEPPSPAFTSAALQRLAEKATGPFYEPKTTAGKYAQTVGEFAPGMIGGPEGLIARAATRVLAPAVGSEAAGQLAENYAPALEPAARIAGAVAGHAAPTGVVRAATHQAPRIPTTDELHQAASQGYRNASGYGVEIRRQHLARLADDMQSDLATDGFRERNIPQTWSAIDELKNPIGRNATIDDVDSVRKVLNKAGAMPGAEREASRRAIAAIDNYLSNLDPRHVAINPHYAADVGREIEGARGNWAAMKRAEDVDFRLTAADLRAASTGTGGNIDNATRQNIRALLTNKKAIRGFSQAERDQMERIVRGTFTGNVARLLGRLAPTGVVSAGLGLEIGSHLLSGPAGLGVIPIAGAVAKRIGDASTARQARHLDEMVRARSPLGRSLPQPAPTPPFPVRSTAASGVLGHPSGEDQQRASGGRVDNTDPKARAIEVLPPDHKLGMRVPRGGSRCGNCRFLASDTKCGNPRFVKWNGTSTLPAPKNEYCCDLYEHGRKLASGGRAMADGGDPGEQDSTTTLDTDQMAAQDAAEAAASRVRAPYVKANERTSGLPQVLDYYGNKIASAVTAPRDALTGALQVNDPETGMPTPEAMQRAQGVANMAMTSGMPMAQRGSLGMFGGMPTYSAAGEAVRGARQQVMHPNQWLGFLKNQPGVKAQELEHVGLEDWLKSQKGPVTRDQVNQFIESQQPQIREVTKNDYEKVENKAPHIIADSALSPINPTKHSQWQLPGGSNYGETLLTLPPKASDIPGWKIVPHPSGEGFALQNPSGEYKLAGPDYRYPGRPLQWETRERAEQGGMPVYNRDQENYTSSHWEEPNVLLHTRHNDRVIPGPNGELLNSLHLEEIQSDWHQAGRKRGYATPGNETFSVEKTGDTWRVLNNRTGMVPYSNIRSEVEARERAAAYNQGSGKVPDAPFKTTWSDLALKRMLHRAATDRNPDGSYKYDAMSWTPGQEQADRYDLSKQVDSVFAHKNSDGTIDLFAEMSRNGRKERVPVQENAHPDKIADYVGKDLADKIAKQKDRKQEYKGADLKVGGEGMRAFYDKMLPDKANALVKKFGTKVEKAQVPTSTRPTSPNSMADQLNDLIEEAGGEPTHAKKAATAPVHMIRITPQLRAAAERGFPTFAYGGAIRATKAIKSA